MARIRIGRVKKALQFGTVAGGRHATCA